MKKRQSKSPLRVFQCVEIYGGGIGNSHMLTKRGEGFSSLLLKTDVALTIKDRPDTTQEYENERYVETFGIHRYS